MSNRNDVMQGHALRHWRRATQRRFGTQPERHELLVLLLGLQGRMRYLIDGQIVTLERGDLLFAFAGQAHVLLSETQNFDMWVVVATQQGVCGAGLPPFTQPDGLGSVVRRTTERDCAALDRLAREVQETTEAQEIGLRWFCVRAWEVWRRAGLHPGAEALPPAVDRAVMALKQDLSLSAGQLAAYVGVQPETLARLFRRSLGESVISFRNRARIEQVDRVMEAAAGQNLLQAALGAGFGSYPQFFRAFQSLRGVGPRAYYQAGERAFHDADRHAGSGEGNAVGANTGA